MKLLSSLQLSPQNKGASTGPDWWSATTDLGEITSINPATGEAIAAIYRSSRDDYEKIIETATDAFINWRLVPAPKRADIIHAIGNELRQHKDALGNLVSLEMGKSKQEGDGEVQEMIDMADLAVGQARMLYGKTMHSERAWHRMYEQWQPLGIVSVISAFNFPVAVWSWNAFLAAVCGNTVVWKPSPKTPLCAIAVQHICNRVLKKWGYNGIFSLFISDDNTLVKHMAQDIRIPLVSFTGSTAVGRELNTLIAGRLGKSLLELSGNNAIIVDEKADLALALPAIVFGAIGTAGQRCTSTRRLIIHASLYDKLVASLIQAYKTIKIGDPLDPTNLMGPLIDEQAVTAFLASVAKAKEQGGEILVGGHRFKRPGFFVEPTLIAAENTWPIVQQETFSPILYVMKYHELSQAIAMQNQSDFGLSSALFTENLQHAEHFLSAAGSDCGIACINLGTSGAEIGGAFGGEKATGGGREAGSDAWQAYMRRQTTTINWGKMLHWRKALNLNCDDLHFQA